MEELGSDFVSFDQAAERLGRTKRSIHSYVKRGLLRKSTYKGKSVLFRKDVEAFAASVGTDLPPVNRKALAMIVSRVEHLESDMAMVRRILSANDDPLRFTIDQEAVSVFKSATDAGKAEEWHLDEIEMWCSLIGRFDETTVAFLDDSVSGPWWTPFYDLMNKLVDFVAEASRKYDSLPLQALLKVCLSARQNLRHLIILRAEITGVDLDQNLLSVLSSRTDSVLGRLS